MRTQMRTTSALGVLLALGLTGPAFGQVRDHREGDKKEEKKSGASASGSATLDLNVNVSVGGGSQKTPPPPKNPVTASGFVPRAGVVGTAVTISGTGFDQRTKVYVGGKIVPKLMSVTPVAISFAFPPRFGDGTIEIRQPTQPAINLGKFTVDVAPKITKFRPLFGPVGTRVEIEGAAFAAADQVNLGAVNVQILERSDARLVAVIPPNATTGKFSVFRGGAPVAVAKQTFTVVLPSPTITSFTPTSGPPGTVVKVLGTNFSADDRVYLGGLQMPVQTRGAGFVDVVVPLNAKLSAPLSVKTVHGTGVSAQPFMVVLPPQIFRFAPMAGAPASQVQLLGRAFLPTDEVRLGDKPATIVNRSEVVLTVTVPANAPSAPWNVVRGGTVVASSKAPFSVTVAPTIAGFSPEAGAPGTKVTITGTGFSPDTKVLYGQQEVRPSARGGETQLFVYVPANATTQPFVVSNRGGTATSAKPFTVQTASTVDLVAPLFGPVGSKVTITGRNMDASDKYYLGATLLPVVERAPGTAVVQIPAAAVSGPILWESWGQKKTSRFKFDVRQAMTYGSFSPAAGPPTMKVKIVGTNFTPTTQVFWGTQQLKVFARTPSELNVIGPSGTPASNPFIIRDGGAEVKATSNYELVMIPVIKGFAPLTASVGGQVTMNGLNFDAAVKVTHNGVVLPYVSVTPTQAYFTIPAAAAGSYPLVLDVKGYQVKSGQNLTITTVAPTPPPPVPPTPTPPTPTPPVPPAPVPMDPNHAAHEHPHEHPHVAGDHHHHPHAHPHKPGSTHHHPY